MPTFKVLIGFSILLASAGVAGAQGKDIEPLAKRAKNILQTHCYRCHGENGAVEGGVNYLLDRHQLVSRKKVIPGEATKSKLYRRVILGEMPPETEKQRPSDEEVAILKKWIEAGAPDFNPAAPKREFVADQAIWERIDADLVKLPEWDRRFTRYFSIAHLYNSGVSEDELETHRQAITKLLNSLSWGKEVVRPEPIDAAKTILRFDLRSYKWSDRTWNLLLDAYPFGILHKKAIETRCQTATRTQLPFIRGDWFVAHAALPPLYHEILQLPSSEQRLEKMLRVEAMENVRDGMALRAGFNGSGVSRNNRLIERHETLYGAYWKSYDFAGSTGRQNLFASPLGPGPGTNTFRHDGGEMIFNLPNGLQAYMLVDGKGHRIDKGPVEVVSDPRRPDRTVVNGLSCMSCHSRGIISKEDQIRPHVEKNQQAFVKTELETIFSVYAGKDRLQTAMDEDARRFQKAVEKTGGKVGATEPIVALALRFEAELDISAAAAELGMPTADLQKQFGKSVTLGRLLGPLALDGGTVQRQVFIEAFAALNRDLELGVAVARFHRPWDPRINPPDSSPPWMAFARPNHFPSLERNDHLICRFPRSGLTHVNAVAIHPKDAKLLASESQVGVVTLWDSLDSTGVRAHFVGHRGNVLAVDFSSDGKFLATGGIDQSARLWEADTGKEFFHFGGHAGFVYSVKFSPDGSLLATGSDCIRLWNTATGKELVATMKLAHWVEHLSFSPDGKKIASASKTGIHIWDVETGREIDRFNPHQVPVHAVAFSPFGERIATAASDGSIVVWDLASKKAHVTWKGHPDPVHSLAFSAHGNVLMSASGGAGKRGEVKAWDPQTGKELAALPGHDKGVACVALSTDGKKAAAAGADATVRVWDLLFLNKTVREAFEGHSQLTTSLAISADGKLALSGSQDKTARIWNVETGKELHNLTGHGDRIANVAIDAAGNAYSCSPDKTVRKWNMQTGKPLQQWDFPGFVSDLALAANGKTLAVIVSGSLIRIVNADTGATLHEWRAQIRHLTFSPDGGTLAGIEAPGKIRFWNVADGKELPAVEVSLDSLVNSLAFSADGDRLLMGSRKGTMVLFDRAAKKEVRRFTQGTKEIRGLVFSKDSKRFYSWGTESNFSIGGAAKGPTSEIILWETASGNIVHRWTDENLVLRVAVLPDERFILYSAGSILKKSSIR